MGDPGTTAAAASATAPVVALAVEFIRPLIPKIAEKVKAKIDEVSVGMRQGFQAYYDAQRERVYYTKTLLYKDDPVAIEDFYVRTRVTGSKAQYTDAEFLDAISTRPQSIVVGTAGSGKSMFMKWLFLQTLKKPTRLPLFYELRSMNDGGAENVESRLLASLRESIPHMSREILRGLFEEGRVVLFLDAFDELDPAIRDRVAREISALSKRYSKLTQVITSRPDELVSSWERFHTFKMLPLSRAQAIELIKKLNYNQAVKDKFLAELGSRLFKAHRSFLSNPLLLTIMLITFEDVGSVPNRMYLFYDEAFKVLFYRHDTSKEVFQRNTQSGLRIDQFRQLLSAFCAITYLKGQHSFSDESLRDYIRRALSIARIEASPELVQKDLLLAICIMMRDGRHIVFTHRAFQEYFTAAFFITLDSERIFAAIQTLQRERAFDSVIPMMLEMNTPLIEERWVLPNLEAIEGSVGNIDPTADYRAYLLALGATTGIIERQGDDVMFSVGFGGDLGRTIYVLDRLYPDADRNLNIEQVRKTEVRLLVERFPELASEDIAGDSGEAESDDIFIEIDIADGEHPWMNSTTSAYFAKVRTTNVLSLLPAVRARVAARRSTLDKLIDDWG